MVYNIIEYFQKEKSMTFDEMIKIHELIEEEIGKDQDAIELYDELIKRSIEYSNIRSKWTLMSFEEKAEKDAGRTMCHDVLIGKFNQLARYLEKQGRSCKWRDMLGYENEDRINRKRIGDMGCYLAFVHGLNAR